MKVEKEDRN